MLYIHNTMINTSLYLGYPLTCWTNSEVMMIPKETNNIQINRIRVINKYEADFNLVFDFFWYHAATRKVDKKGLLEDNQWDTQLLCISENQHLLKYSLQIYIASHFVT